MSIDKKEFAQLREEVFDLQLKLKEKDRHERGGTTIREAIDSGAFAEGFIALMKDPEYIRKEVRDRLEMLFGDGESYGLEGSFSNIYRVAINSVDHPDFERDLNSPGDPEYLGTYAARHYGKRKAANRVATLRKLANLCGRLADAFEERQQRESVLRRVQ